MQDSLPMPFSELDADHADEVHNRQNQLLKEGLDALGMHSARTPRNINDPQDQCGFTTFGCARGNKQVYSSFSLHNITDMNAQHAGSCKLTLGC